MFRTQAAHRPTAHRRADEGAFCVSPRPFFRSRLYPGQLTVPIPTIYTLSHLPAHTKLGIRGKRKSTNPLSWPRSAWEHVHQRPPAKGTEGGGAFAGAAWPIHSTSRASTVTTIRGSTGRPMWIGCRHYAAGSRDVRVRPCIAPAPPLSCSLRLREMTLCATGRV